MCVVQLRGGQFDEKYVKSTRIRTGRSVKGFCLPPSISRAERREVEKTIVEALGGLSGDLSGKYYPLKGMTKEEEAQLIAVSSFTFTYTSQHSRSYLPFKVISRSSTTRSRQ